MCVYCGLLSSQVAHLERGVYGWYQADYDFGGEGEYQPDLGRTPMAAAEPVSAPLIHEHACALIRADCGVLHA